MNEFCGSKIAPRRLPNPRFEFGSPDLDPARPDTTRLLAQLVQDIQLTGEVASYGALPVIRVAALISLIIGVTNLFPIPALDGSRVVFVIVEALRKGKRLKPQTEGMIHFVGFALLVILLFIITYQDIMRIVHGQSLLG